MSNKFNKIIIGAGILLVGILGSLATKFLPNNVIGLVVLMVISVCKFGGLIMFIAALITFFSKEKKEEEVSLVHKIVKKNKMLMYCLIYLIVGGLFCSSSYLLPYLCGGGDVICPVTSVGLSFLFFIPVGIVFIIMALFKLYKFLKYKC